MRALEPLPGRLRRRSSDALTKGARIVLEGCHCGAPAHAVPTICPQLQISPVSYSYVFSLLDSIAAV
jgi:hypothetical protein